MYSFRGWIAYHIFSHIACIFPKKQLGKLGYQEKGCPQVQKLGGGGGEGERAVAAGSHGNSCCYHSHRPSSSLPPNFQTHGEPPSPTTHQIRTAQGGWSMAGCVPCLTQHMALDLANGSGARVQPQSQHAGLGPIGEPHLQCTGWGHGVSPSPSAWPQPQCAVPSPNTANTPQSQCTAPNPRNPSLPVLQGNFFPLLEVF